MKIRRLTVVLFASLIVCLYGVGNVTAIECSHPSLPEALDALESSDDVTVETVEVDSWDGLSPAEPDDNIYYVFVPKGTVPRDAFIILPGGNCDPKAYAPAAHAIAAKKYLTVIVPMPNCVAIGGRGRADKIIEDFAEIENWVIGGHSVGGTAACIYADNHSTIDGVVIWASLSPGGLEDTDMKVLTLYGSNDGRVGPEDVLANAGALPADTIFKEIEGGNHTQFGYFDTTPDSYMTEDNAATITLENQQNIIVRETVDFLNMISGRTACLVSNLLGEEDARLDTVRQFRDEVLSKTPEGQEIISLYYEWSPVIVKAMEENERFKQEAKEMIDEILPMIR
jgi:hypothetical protein